MAVCVPSPEMAHRLICFCSRYHCCCWTQTEEDGRSQWSLTLFPCHPNEVLSQRLLAQSWWARERASVAPGIPTKQSRYMKDSHISRKIGRTRDVVRKGLLFQGLQCVLNHRSPLLNCKEIEALTSAYVDTDFLSRSLQRGY